MQLQQQNYSDTIANYHKRLKSSQMNHTEDSLLLDALNRHFGFKVFKGEQKEIIESLLEGKDTFVIMPTGGGKSLCYQLPAMLSEGIAIIISPLIALMKNQVDLVRGYSSNDSVAHFMNSSLNKMQLKKVKDDLLDGNTKMLYIAPETLTKDSTIQFLKELKISFVAVDEAHCISEWGHDFRPEYRRIRTMIEDLGQKIPIIALTATATPKVRTDIVKTLKLENPNIFISSFNRPNLYYEIRPKLKKDETIRNIIQFVKHNQGKSGIIYCLNRKTTEELAETLQVNGVRSAAYHAGLDAVSRSTVQDHFLMEEIEVIVATIAFGMGIDKPDVRFVIHYDMPKSLENYYQETGRAGRDGLEGKCVGYFSYKDMNKLDKFLRDKPVMEREIGAQHLGEVVAYSESASCKRQFLLHYFGEIFDAKNCNGGCDSCAHPREKIDAKNYIKIAVQAVQDLDENSQIKHLVDYLNGIRTQQIIALKQDVLPNFGKGKEENSHLWNSIYRQALLQGFLIKDIEEYGIIKISDTGRAFLKAPYSVMMALNHQYSEEESADEGAEEKTVALDETLLAMLKDLRKSVAKQMGVPPFVVFQDISLNDMATAYPITIDEMANIIGVSKGKALKYAPKFISLIEKYVEENDIDRPSEFVTKQVANKSRMKVSIIQSVDKKIPLPEIARSSNVTMQELLSEIESIVSSGTKLNLSYYIGDVVDEELQEEVYDYFMNAETDDPELAIKEIDYDGEVSLDDVRLVRVQFLSDMAN